MSFFVKASKVLFHAWRNFCTTSCELSTVLSSGTLISCSFSSEGWNVSIGPRVISEFSTVRIVELFLLGLSVMRDQSIFLSFGSGLGRVKSFENVSALKHGNSFVIVFFMDSISILWNLVFPAATSEKTVEQSLGKDCSEFGFSFAKVKCGVIL